MSFKPQTANQKPFSWGFKRAILFCKRELPLCSAPLRGAGEQSTALPRCDMLPLTFFEGYVTFKHQARGDGVDGFLALLGALAIIQ